METLPSLSWARWLCGAGKCAGRSVVAARVDQVADVGDVSAKLINIAKIAHGGSRFISASRRYDGLIKLQGWIGSRWRGGNGREVQQH
jgi:hypothetical protein